MKVSKGRLKILVSDLKVLEREMKRPGVIEGVEKLLATIADGRLEPDQLRTMLRRGYEDESARALDYLLNNGDTEILEQLKNYGFSTDMISFLEKTMNTYAFAMKDYKTVANYPADIERAITRFFYSFDAEAPYIHLQLTTRKGEEAIFEGPVGTYMWLLIRLLSDISDLMKQVKKDIPSKFMTPSIKKRLKQLDAGYREFQEVFVMKESDSQPSLVLPKE